MFKSLTSPEEACKDLGFDPKDLTRDELEELDNWVFRYDDCGDKVYTDEFGDIYLHCVDLEKKINGYNAKSL